MKSKKKKSNTHIIPLIILLSGILVILLSVIFSSYFKSLITNTFNSITDKNWVYKGNDIYYCKDDVMATGWQKINNRFYFFNPDGTLEKQMKMIDVSEHQGYVDWNAVKQEGIQIAMLRCSYGWKDFPAQVDKTFEQNYKNAKAAGLKIGVYHYSYATNGEEAVLEANYVKKALKGKEIDFEVAYDIEDDDIHEGMTSKQFNELVYAFCNEIENAGYIPMLYSNSNLINKLYDDNGEFDLWIADYNGNCNYNNDFLVWQYTDTGLISGIDGFTDFNIRYFKP